MARYHHHSHHSGPRAKTTIPALNANDRQYVQSRVNAIHKELEEFNTAHSANDLRIMRRKLSNLQVLTDLLQRYLAYKTAMHDEAPSPLELEPDAK